MADTASAETNGAVIRLRDVHKSFRTVKALEGVDLEVGAGESLAVLGGSGSGKSVLLKIITGLIRPDRGEVWVFGTRADPLDEDGWEPLRVRAGMLFQGGALFDSMSVGENVAFPLRERKVDPARIRDVVKERLSWVGLEDTAGRRTSELSGGMRKRVALARAIVTDPQLILYDEPTTGLDPLTGRRIAELIRGLNRRLGSSSIVVTHDLVCASIVADRWAFIGEGRILCDGPPSQLRRLGCQDLDDFLSAAVMPDDGPLTRSEEGH
jgi:phospholipid/cholesterol/gamma-HCH transport system ATP-binding protein